MPKMKNGINYMGIKLSEGVFKISLPIQPEVPCQVNLHHGRHLHFITFIGSTWWFESRSLPMNSRIFIQNQIPLFSSPYNGQVPKTNPLFVKPPYGTHITIASRISL